MAENLILRNENELPADVRALLHAPPPEGVWHCPSHPRIGNPFRVAAAITLVLLILMLIFFVMVNVDAWNRGNLRSEGFFISLILVLFPAGLYWLCRRFKVKAERLEADVQAGRVRYGLWLTAQHVLVNDYEGMCCARKQEIAKTHVYHAGGGRPDLLVLTLMNQQLVYILANALDGWYGQSEKLCSEFDQRLKVNPGISTEEMQKKADYYLPRTNFCYFIIDLDKEAVRLKSGAAEKAALIAMAETALAAWPEKVRSPLNEFFMTTEIDGTYEYGVNNAYCGGTITYHGFHKEKAHWLLPLCRTVSFYEAELIFPNVASVQDCAATFQNVPLTMIEFTGGMEDDVFDAFLAWAATKPLKMLTARNYSTERNSVSNLRDHLRKQLVAFKEQHHLA